MNDKCRVSRSIPHVSVVVIVLNGARTIGACLDSLIAQTYDKWDYEVVVVDNGSTDGTIDIVRQYPVRLVSEPVKGYASARNAGVKVARGHVIAFVDSDCVAAPDWLEKLTAPFQDSRVGAVAGDIRCFRTDRMTLVEHFIDCTQLCVQSRPAPNGILPYIAAANCSYRRGLIFAAGLFDTHLPSCEDVELARRVQLLLGVKAIYKADAVVYHKHRRDISGLIRFLKRNGRDEMLLAARWKQYPEFETSCWQEVKHMARQLFAMMVYLRSMAYRSLVYARGGKDRAYLAYPALWFLAEGANLVGKIQGLVETRMLRCTR